MIAFLHDKNGKKRGRRMVKIIPRYFLSFKTNGSSVFLKEKYIAVR